VIPGRDRESVSDDANGSLLLEIANLEARASDSKDPAARMWLLCEAERYRNLHNAELTYRRALGELESAVSR
jgi:hypothetical protein